MLQNLRVPVRLAPWTLANNQMQGQGYRKALM